MRFANRRFRQTLRKLKTRRLKSKTRRSKKQSHKQKGGGNTLTRDIPKAAVIVNPGKPLHEEQDADPEGALE